MHCISLAKRGSPTRSIEFFSEIVFHGIDDPQPGAAALLNLL
jgi:hypothetical protein